MGEGGWIRSRAAVEAEAEEEEASTLAVLNFDLTPFFEPKSSERRSFTLLEKSTGGGGVISNQLTGCSEASEGASECVLQL